jgi:hypothetical protein
MSNEIEQKSNKQTPQNKQPDNFQCLGQKEEVQHMNEGTAYDRVKWSNYLNGPSMNHKDH